MKRKILFLLQSVQAQIKEMREYFKAWATSNRKHRDYLGYFIPNLCYLEGFWNKNPNFTEPFKSKRHRVDAKSFADVAQKAEFTEISGRKDASENFLRLPTRLVKDENGVVEEAHWSYRIACVAFPKWHLPLTRFRVVDDVCK